MTIYCIGTFIIGLVLTIPVALWVNQDELGTRGGAIMTLSWNVLFSMILPLVLDWCERKHCKVRFLNIEEIAKTNPELAAVISEKCRQLAIAHLRLAVADTPTDETFSYGLWGHNPRLILPGKLLNSHDKAMILPSIEAELNHFASQDHTMVFLLFTVVQVLLQQMIIAMM
ncbi:MAG: hypothetical protein HY711_08940 [Candidatus Melainabacteria bacterium]|nr:hypothetical protein [Candidatus Melainabacteria bacterium]